MADKNDRGPVKENTVLKEETRDITPDTNTAQTVTKTNKAFHACVTDLIDNCFDARTEDQLAGKEPLLVDVIIDPQQGGAVRIVDNARGMNDRQAQDAFTLGRTDKKRKNVFGFHGFGLKVSSGAIGNEVEVTTQPERGFEKYVVNYDPTALKGWTIKLKTLAAIPGQHGTEVCIPKRKMFVARWTIEKLIAEIGTCYFDELQADRARVHIHYGKETIKCMPIDHKWTENGKFEGVLKVFGHDVPFIVGCVDTPRSVSQAKNGFEIYVNGRKIESRFLPKAEVKGKVHGLSTHPESSRVYGRIFTTSAVLEMNTDKTAVIRNENFWEMNNQLAVHPLLAEAKKMAKRKNKEAYQNDLTPNESTRLDIVRRMNEVARIEKDKKAKKQVERRDGGPHGDGPAPPPCPPSDDVPVRDRKPKKTHPVMRKIRSNMGMFDLFYMDFPEHEGDLTSETDIDDDGVITVYINVGHRAFLNHGDPYIYAYEEAAIAVMLNSIMDGVDAAFAARGVLLNNFLSLTPSEIEDIDDISTVEVAAANPD